MTPPVSLLGFVSIPSVWVITNLGLPSDIWTFGVIPLLSICFSCDQRKLWQAAVQVRGSLGLFIGSAIVTYLCICNDISILYARVTYTRFVLWKLAVALVWLLCIITGFQLEKQMYLMDTFGAVAKYLVWKVVTRFTGEEMWVGYKSEWAYCSPYSKKLVHKEIDHYYNLQKRLERQETIPENYAFNFRIESCRVYAVYTYSTASDVRGGRGGDCSASRSTVSDRPMENLNHTLPSIPGELCSIEFTKSADTESASSTTLQTEGESLSAKAKRGPLVEDSYTLISSYGCSKVEVSLNSEDKTLEGYTFYNVAYDALAEFKRVLEVLKEEGNVIFSTINRNVVSSRPRAHARCYEFRELLELILNESYKLHEVVLRAKYKCIISGHWTLQLQAVVLIGVMVGINYYQLTGPPKHVSIVIVLLTIYGLTHLFLFSVTLAWSEQHKVKRLVHFIISRTGPRKVDDWYKYFQVRFPHLTFANESYCYPYVSSQRQICYLEGTIGCLPVLGTEHGYFHMEDLREGIRVFDMRNLQLELSVTYMEGEVQIEVLMRRVYNNNSCCYREIFQTNRRKAIDFIALMTWLQKNRCAGVCKEWPESGLMYAYRYPELFQKVLKDGLRPMIATFIGPIDITVE